MLIGASILASDLIRLGEQIASAEHAGADWIHIDVMDGRFVPNITFGPLIVEAARRSTSLPLDVHLMIEDPERYVPEFVDAGASFVTVHVETTRHIHRTLALIEERGARPGVTLNPGTPVSWLEPVLQNVALVLVMSVSPGFGGQMFIPSTPERIRSVRRMLAEREASALVSVDGGINATTVRQVTDAGVDVLIAGSSVFRHRDGINAGVAELRRAAGRD